MTEAGGVPPWAINNTPRVIPGREASCAPQRFGGGAAVEGSHRY